MYVMLVLRPGSILLFTQQYRLRCHDFWAGMNATTNKPSATLSIHHQLNVKKILSDVPGRLSVGMNGMQVP